MPCLELRARTKRAAKTQLGFHCWQRHCIIYQKCFISRLHVMPRTTPLRAGVLPFKLESGRSTRYCNVPGLHIFGITWSNPGMNNTIGAVGLV